MKRLLILLATLAGLSGAWAQNVQIQNLPRITSPADADLTVVEHLGPAGQNTSGLALSDLANYMSGRIGFGAFNTQPQNWVLAAPTIGSGPPSFRALVDGDIPQLYAKNAAAAITGGTIDGTPIGGTSPAAGAFTTLSATVPLPATSGGTGSTAGALLLTGGTLTGLLTASNITSTANPSLVQLYAGQNVNAGLVYDLTAQSSTAAEQTGVFRMTSNTGGTSVSHYKMALGAETIAGPLSAPVWAMTAVLTTQSGYQTSTQNQVAFEIDQNNNSGTDCTDLNIGVSGSPCGQVYITGAGINQLNFGLGISGNSKIRNGVVFFTGGPVATSLLDYSSSQLAWKDVGVHINGLDASGATYSGGKFLIGPSNLFVAKSDGSLSAKSLATTGSIGVAVASPLALAHIFDTVSSTTEAQLLLQNQGGAVQTAAVAFQVASSSEYTSYGPKGGLAYQRNGANGRGDFYFYNRAANDTAGYASTDAVMKLQNGGNVGIGTTSPNAKLDVGGTLRLSGGTPTIATNACGSTTQGTIAAGGTDETGVLTIGTASVTSCTVSLSATLSNAFRACVLTAANSTAAAAGSTLAYVSAITTSSWTVTGSALAGASYQYHCI